MNRFRILSIFLCLLNTALFGIENISLKLLNDNECRLTPGTTSNIVVKLTNNGDIPEKVLLKVNIPSGWNQIMSYNSVDIKANSSRTKVLCFHVPETCLEGDYPITVDAFSKPGNEKIGTLKLSVFVLPKHELLLKEINITENVFSGDTIEVEYLIQNLSNKKANVEAKIYAGDVEIRKFNLAPDSFVITKVSVVTKKNLEFQTRKNILFNAAIEGYPETQKTLSFIFDIIPKSEFEFDPYVRYPIKASSIIATDNQFEERQNAFLFDISGTGSISQNNNRKLSFKLRGPNRRGEPLIGTTDFYQLKYSSSKNKLVIGDGNFGMSGLTESSRLGRGIRYEHTKSKLMYGGFINFPRYYPQIDNVFAVYSHYNHSTNYIFSTGYLLKSFAESDPAHLFSLKGICRPFPWLTADSELSGGYMSGKLSNAIQANMKAKFFIFRTFLNFTRADEDFPGYFSNTMNVAGGVRMTLKKKVNVYFNYVSNYSNLALDTMYSNAPYSKNINVSFSYKINKNHSIGFSVIKRNMEDRMEPVLFDFEELSYRLNLQNRIKKITLSLSGELGKVNNFKEFSEGETINTSRGYFSMKYKISKTVFLDAFLNYMGSQRYLSSSLNDVFYGGSINLKFKKLILLTTYQSNYQIEEYYKDRSIIDFSCIYKINSKNELSLETYYNLMKNSLDKKELKVLFKYTRIINAPLRKKKNTACLSGSIKNNGVENVEGIEISFSGSTTKTDRNGRFEFPVIQAGEGYLSVDKSKMGLNSISEKPGPFKLDIKPGETNTIEIAFTLSAKINGKLVIREDEKSSSKNYMSTKEKLENLIVEAKMENEMFRVISDENGEFVFNDLRPGTWTIKIYKTGIPKGYELESETYNIDLSPNQTKILNVNIQKKARKVKFQKSFNKGG